MGLFKDCGCGCNGKIQEKKFITSIISGLTFFIVANPETFRIVRKILGPRIATPTGCPSTLGLLIHSIVFFLIVWGMMNIGNENRKSKKTKCGCGGKKGSKKTIKAPVAMVDAPDPKPDFGESSIDMGDSGRVLEAMDVSSEGNLFN